MPKVILFNLLTLDGCFEGPNGEIDWHTVDEEFNQFAVQQLRGAGGLIFGRRTYALMAQYWPTPAARSDDPLVAEQMNRLPKYVFSRRPQSLDWANSHLIQGEAAEGLARLKQQPGGDLLVFGSANLAESLAQAGLIDEYRIMLAPLALGRGRPMFQGLPQPLPLQRLDTRTFGNGNVLLVYQPQP